MAGTKTAKEMVEQWDRGESVWTIEMGGMGPGYEQAIQVLVIELLRDHLDEVFDDATDPAAYDRWGDETVHRVNEWPGCGFSGAQVGAAKFVAYGFLRDGPESAMAKFQTEQSKRAPGEDRLILVSKTWPHQPEPSEGVTSQ